MPATQTAATNPYSLRGYPDPPTVKGIQCNFKALAFRINEVGLRHLHVIQHDFVGGRGADAHFLLSLRHSKAFGTGIHDK